MAIIGEKITLDKPLVGNIARNQMESKMELTTRGALYVGTGQANSVTPDGGGDAVPIPITSHIAPNGASDNGKVLVADSKETVGWKISDTCPKAKAVTTDIGTQKITDIFESDGKTAKSATIAKGLQSNTAQTTNGTNWYEFNGTNEYFGSTNSPTIIKTSEARPKAEVPSGSATVTKEIALLEDVQGDAEWSDIVQSAKVSAGLYYVLMNVDEVLQTAGDPSIVFFDGTHWAHGIPYVNCGVVDGAFIIQTYTPHIDPGYDTMTATYAKVTCENGVWTQVKMDQPSKFKYRKIK